MFIDMLKSILKTMVFISFTGVLLVVVTFLMMTTVAFFSELSVKVDRKIKAFFKTSDTDRGETDMSELGSPPQKIETDKPDYFRNSREAKKK